MMKRMLVATLATLSTTAVLPAMAKPQAKPEMAASAATITQFYDVVVNQGHVDQLNRFCAASFVEHQMMSPDQAPGLEGVKKGFQDLRQAFPDLKFHVDDIIRSGDKAVVRYTMTGTNKGSFMGMPPSGKSVKTTGIDVMRFAGGKVVEHWGNSDDLGMMQQLGAMPNGGPEPTK